MRKSAFCICENKGADQLRDNQRLFALKIVQSLHFLNMKFEASRHLLWLYSPVCVGPSWSERDSIDLSETI